MTIAAVLGLDTAAGAYLARLLGARGVMVRGTGGPALLEKLGIADDVTRTGSVEAATLGVDLIYDLRGDAGATTSLLPLLGHRRLFVAVDPDDAAQIATLAAARAAGRFVATGRVYPHESRLGPGTSPVARIVAAAARGHDPDPADLATATDCGWTPEFVDAMARILQPATASDVAIATGRAITGVAAARTATRWFKRQTLRLTAEPAPVAECIETTRAAAQLGWRATTWGDDLVEVLCEGAAG